MAYDRVEECPHIRLQLKAGELAQQILEGLLKHIQRLLRVTCESKSEINDPPSMSVVQCGKGSEIAGIGRLDELGVATWIVELRFRWRHPTQGLGLGPKINHGRASWDRDAARHPLNRRNRGYVAAE